MNEVRFGDLTRMGEMPYSPNYGSVHSTPLFLMLLASRPSGSGRPPG
jgi:hypothetical protein